MNDEDRNEQKKPDYRVTADLLKIIQNEALSRLRQEDTELFETIAASLSYLEETLLKREAEFEKLHDLNVRQLNKLKKLNQSLRDSMNEFQLVFKNESVINRITEPSKLLDLYMAAVARVLDYETSCVYLINETTRHFERSRDKGLTGPMRDFLEKKLNNGTFAWVLKQGHASAMPFPGGKTDAAPDIRNAIFVPLIAGEFPTGVSIFFSAEDASEFTPQIFSLTETLSAHYAVYIELAAKHKALFQERKEIADFRNYLDSILENLSVGILVLDKEERIAVINRTTELLFNLSSEKHKNKKLEKIFSGDVLRDLQEVVARAAKGDVPVDYETSYQHSSGVLFNIGLTPSVLRDSSGAPTGTVIICRDLFSAEEMNRLRESEKTSSRELRGLSEALRQTQEKLIQADRLSSIGQITAGIAHEINNPLGTISGFIQMLEMEISDNRELKGYVRNIKGEIERIHDLVKNLLDFARYKAKPGEEALNRVDAAEVLNSTIDIMEKQIFDAGITLKKDTGRKPLIIQGIQTELQQVYMNLILNAIHAMDDGGALSVNAERRASSPAERDQWRNLFTDAPSPPPEAFVCISFSDTGKGIRKENMRHIFEPFFTTREQGSGTGLGLSVTYGIIERFRGLIDVESRWQRGACFTIKLPAAKTEPAT